MDLRGGEQSMVNRAKITLQTLYAKLESGHFLETGDVEGAIRMSQSSPDQASQKYSHSARSKSKLKKIVYFPRRKNWWMHARPCRANILIAMANHELVFGVGPAGTGKTYLAVAHAASFAGAGGDRPHNPDPPGGRGGASGWVFSPGDMKEKVDPYLRPTI